MPLRNYFSGFVFFAVSLSGCGVLDQPPVATSQYYSMDGVKLIVSGDDQPRNPNDFGQAAYSLDENHRLLLRFESFAEQAPGVDLSAGKTVRLQVTASQAAPVGNARESLKACPLTRNWMMLATWQYAHPFLNGKWAQAGGDFEAAGCISPIVVNERDSVTITFDVTAWFSNYVRGRAQNYGLVLISSSPVTIVGETSGNDSPRIFFDHFVSSTGKQAWYIP